MTEVQPASPSSEFRIQIDRSAAPGSGAGPKLSNARKQNEAIAEQVRARRTQIHQQHLVDQQAMSQAKDADAAAMQSDPPPDRENIDSIEFEHGGMAIVYGPPRNISVADRIARMYVGRDPSMSEFRLARILMGIRSINGTPVAPITNEIDRTALANRVGDEIIDLLMYYDRTHFPALRQSEVPVVRKIFR